MFLRSYEILDYFHVLNFFDWIFLEGIHNKWNIPVLYQDEYNYFYLLDIIDLLKLELKFEMLLLMIFLEL